MNYICKKIEILYYLICFINYYLPLCSNPILTPADIMAPIAPIRYQLFPTCPYAPPRPARGEMEPIYGLDTVACNLFPDIHGAPV